MITTPFKQVANKQSLELLYENIRCRGLDYLSLENVENFDWDSLFIEYERQKYARGYSIHCEAIERTSSTEEQDCYTITHPGGIKMFLNINFLPKTYFDTKLIHMLTRNKGTPQLGLIRDLQYTIQHTDEPIADFFFTDSENNTHLTNKIGNKAFSVMGGIELALQDSGGKRGYFPDVVTFKTLKTEHKRVDFYRNVLRNFYGSERLNNIYTYDMGDKHEETFIWKTLTPGQFKHLPQ